MHQLTKMRQRIEFIDVARGLAMLLVVFGHCFKEIGAPLNKVVLSFHMPLFFLVSGMFVRSICRSNPIPEIIRKAKVILIPQIAVVLLAAIRPISQNFVKGGSVDYIRVFDFFGWSVWFLPTLFLCVMTFLSVGYVVDINKTRNKIICLIIALILVPISVNANRYGFTSFMHCLQIFPIAFSFFILGSILKAGIAELENSHSNSMGIAAIAAMCLCVVISYINEPVAFYQNEYGNLILFYISALLGCFAVLYFTTFLTESKLLKYVGKDCIAFYAWNGFVAWSCMNIAYRVLSMFTTIVSVTIIAFASFIIALPTLYIIVRITMKYIPWLYGISKS